MSNKPQYKAGDKVLVNGVATTITSWPEDNVGPFTTRHVVPGHGGDSEVRGTHWAGATSVRTGAIAPEADVSLVEEGDGEKSTLYVPDAELAALGKQDPGPFGGKTNDPAIDAVGLDDEGHRGKGTAPRAARVTESGEDADAAARGEQNTPPPPVGGKTTQSDNHEQAESDYMTAKRN